MEEKTTINGLGEDIKSEGTSSKGKVLNSESDSTINAVLSENSYASHVNHSIPQKKISRHSNIVLWLKDIKYRISSTYSKRNPIVNALLSLFLFAVIILSIFILNMAIRFLFMEIGNNNEWCFGIAWIYYCLFCIYYMCRFIIGNHKNAILPAFIGLTLVCFVVWFFYVILTTPNSEFLDEEGNESSSSDVIMFVAPLALSIFFNAVAYGLIYLTMKIRKYGASAWALLDIHRGDRSKFEKISFIIFIIISFLPIGAVAYTNYKSKLPIADEYPTHASAQIGDFYYSDGTVSSVWDVDKTAIGIVFSLETSETDRIQGFTHGQIVALSDLSDNKQPWDGGNFMDIIEYPNYGWENRMDALKDINGLGYMHCNGNGALPMTYDCINFLKQDEISGISHWYVPTAGQWTKILENLGNTKVDKLLKFDAYLASESLDWIHLDPKRWYWTITEFDAENAWSIRLANGEFGSRSNKHEGAYIRPVASF